MSATCGRVRERCCQRQPSPARPRTGWQQVNFPQPVAVTANTVYVASYHTSTGFYSANGAYFTSATVNGSARGAGERHQRWERCLSAMAPAASRPIHSTARITGSTWCLPRQLLAIPRHRLWFRWRQRRGRPESHRAQPLPAPSVKTSRTSRRRHSNCGTPPTPSCRQPCPTRPRPGRQRSLPILPSPTRRPTPLA